MSDDNKQACASVEAVARRAKYLLNRMENDDGIGIGEFDTMLRMAASLTPAPTQGERHLRQLRALAVALHARHYAEVLQWQPLDDAEGLLSQIDNMTAGLCRREPAGDPTQHEKETANSAFREWWDREQACPEHSLTTQNAAHAAWQEAYRVYRTPSSPVSSPSPAGGVREAFSAHGCKAVSDNGKRWRIVPDEGDWEMQPIGRVTAGEAQAICEGFVGLIRERDRFLRLWNEERDRNAALSSPATPVQPTASVEAVEPEMMEALYDKIEGLEADLESAVEVAFRRGAAEWTRLNYPTLYTRLNAALSNPAPGYANANENESELEKRWNQLGLDKKD